MYERTLLLVDADAHTRDFYASNGIRLSDPVLPFPDIEPAPQAPTPPASVPGFTGGGGSDDADDWVSRSSSLVPSPPRRVRGEDVVFRFTAEMK